MRAVILFLLLGVGAMALAQGRPGAVIRPAGVRVVAVKRKGFTVVWSSRIAARGRLHYRAERGKEGVLEDETFGIHHEVDVTGLSPSSRVWFRVAPAPDGLTTGSFTPEYSTATLPARGKMQYLHLPILVVVPTAITYRDREEGATLPPGKPAHLTPADRKRLEEQMEIVRAFFWRNSRCKLDLRWDYHFTERPFVDSGPGRQKLFEAALSARGKKPNDYGGCMFLYGWDDYLEAEKSRTLYRGQAFGGLTYGVDGGWDYKEIPHSWIKYTHGCDVTWVVAHEFHHELDSLFMASGHPEYAFNHPTPVEPVGPFGEHWDANAFILRQWRPTDWFALTRGELRTAPDRVGDGMPDKGDLAITRQSFHGRGRKTGWTDMRMLLASNGVLTGISNGPIHMERWGGRDRLPDGRNQYPLYGKASQRPQKTPTLDGRIDENEWTPFVAMQDREVKAQTFLNWDEQGLYFAARLDRPMELRLQIDATRNGWFNGSDNYRLNLTPTADGAVKVDVHTLDWERFEPGKTYEYANREKVKPEHIRVATGRQDGKWVIEFLVPRNEHTGIVPRPGGQLGLSWGFAPGWKGNDRRLVSLFESCTLFAVTLHGP